MSKAKTSETLRQRGMGSRWTGEQLFLLEKFWERYSSTELKDMLKVNFNVDRTVKTITQCHYAYFGSGAKKRKPNFPQEYHDLKAGRKTFDIQWNRPSPKAEPIKTPKPRNQKVPYIKEVAGNVDLLSDGEITSVQVQGRIGTVSIETKRSFQEILAFLVFLSG